MEYWIIGLCFGLPSVIGLVYLPVALLVTYRIPGEGRPDVFDWRAVLQEIVAPPLRWLTRSPALPRTAHTYGLFGLYAKCCTRQDVETVAKSWRFIMANSPWCYPASQRQRLKDYHRDALVYLDSRDALRAVVEGLRKACDDALAARQREQAQARANQAPAAAVGSWRAALGLPHGECDVERIKKAYRKLVTQAHPDRGGSNEAMVRLNQAIAQARMELAFV